jgi:hypothetical protein
VNGAMGERSIGELEKDLEGLKETMAIYLASLVREVVRAFGDKGKEVIKEAARKGGLWQGEKYIREHGIQERGTKAFADFYNRMSDVELFKIRADQASEKSFVIRANVCPYVGIWREMGIAAELPEFCVLATYYDLGLAQAFNPNLRIRLPRDMLRGDCECVYEFLEDPEDA